MSARSEPKRAGRGVRSAGGATGASLVALGCVAVLCLHAASYLPFLSDDALISLRYARRLLEGSGLTWTDGPRVEGYSNLLWLLLCAGLGALGVDLIAAARALGVASAAGALLGVWRAGSGDALLPRIAGALGLALSGSVAAWTIGGLEQPLLAALLVWACVGLYPAIEPGAALSGARAWAPGAALALLCWTRPDGALLAGACGLGVLLARGGDRAALAFCARLAALPALAVSAQEAFRLLYYGAWLPNPALVKLSFGGARLLQGLAYLDAGLRSHLGLLLLAGVAALAARGDGRAAARLRLLAVPLVLWCIYVVSIGGDVFPAHRHLVPAVALLALMVAEGLSAALRRETDRARGWAWAGTGAALALLVAVQAVDPHLARARTERWEWDGRVVGELLRRAFGAQRPLLAVDPAGTLPYFSRLPALDMLGLNDRTLARRGAPDLGRGWLGHELGDGDYVLSREPDLVLFCSPAGGAAPCFRSGRELVADPRFRDRYRLVQLEGRDPYPVRTRIWARLEGGRIGVSREPGLVRVPGWLLSVGSPAPARLDGRGRLVLAVGADAPAVLPGLALDPGVWTLRARADGGPLQLSLTPSRGVKGGAGGGAGGVGDGGTGLDALRLAVPERGRYDVGARAANAGDRVVIEELLFTAGAP